MEWIWNIKWKQRFAAWCALWALLTFIKPCHAVFHNVGNVEKCTIRLSEEEQRLVFDLLCKRGIKKTSKIAFEQSEALQAIYSKENCPIKIAARPKQLVESLPNFHSHLEEISILVSKDGLHLKSHADDTKGKYLVAGLYQSNCFIKQLAQRYCTLSCTWIRMILRNLLLMAK